MKKLLVSMSLFCLMIVSNVLAYQPRGVVSYSVEARSVVDIATGVGIVICFIAIVLVMLLIKIRINKKK